MSSCRSRNFFDFNTKVNLYKQQQRWDQVALQYDMQIARQGSSECVPDMFEALKNFGLYQLPLDYLDSNASSRYECAWRLGQWNLNKTDLDQATAGYEEYKYFAMKALHDNDDSNLASFLNSARKAVAESLRHTSLESSKNVYDALFKLQSLQGMEDFYLEKEGGDVARLQEKWRVQNGIRKNSFWLVEPILMQRIVLLQNMLNREEGIGKQLTEMQLEVTS